MRALARSVSSTVHDALVPVLVVALILEKRQRVTTSVLVRVPLPVKQGFVVMLRSISEEYSTRSIDQRHPG